jgi:hypothetical protein
MRFDLGSFIIGALVAFVVSFAAYKRRDRLSALWQKIRARLAAFKDQLTAGVEQRYRKALLAYRSLTNASRPCHYVAQRRSSAAYAQPDRSRNPSARVDRRRCAAPGAWQC